MPTAAKRIGSILLLACFLLMPMCLTSCKTTQKSSTASSPAAPSPRQEDLVLQKLESEYAIGPRKARSLGFRIGWQSPQPDRNLTKIIPTDDSIFTLSDENLLHRITTDNGTSLWTATVGSPGDNIHGVNYLPKQKRVYVIRDGSIMSLDSTNGILASGKSESPIQRLQWLANTAGVVHGNHIIYGSIAGELVWHTFDIGFAFKAYKIGQNISLAPELINNTIIGIAASGEIVAINAETVSMQWHQKLLDTVVAKPGLDTQNASAIYVACVDQYLRAFSLTNGSVLWRALTESPLTSSPTPLGSNVYQQVPGHGLACYESLPVNRFDGLRKWITAEVTGSVLTTRGNNLITWDPETRQMCLVSASTGTVEETLVLDTVTMIITDKIREGRLYTFDERGRLDCLIPLTN